MSNTSIRKPVSLALTLAILAAFSLSNANASERGELLYENHCQECHDSSVHTRVDRLVTSPEALRAWVMSWIVHNELPWGADEAADITAYLNRTIYRFTEKTD